MRKKEATQVLIIEDCIRSVLTLRNLLANENFDIISSCREQSIKLCMQKEPNIILLDFHLENGIGFETLKKLKTNKRTRHIPVIVLSNSDTQKSWDESYKFGADAYLVKPDHYPLLIENINHILYNEQEYNPHFFEAAMVF